MSKQSSKKLKHVFKNTGRLVALVNPAPLVTNSALAYAKANGMPEGRHRGNTPWYVLVVDLNAIVLLRDNEKLLKGWQNKDRMLELADDTITWLESLEPAELVKVQTEVPEFSSWPETDRIGQTVIVQSIPRN